jgi:hypothetical protein
MRWFDIVFVSAIGVFISRAILEVIDWILHAAMDRYSPSRRQPSEQEGIMPAKRSIIPPPEPFTVGMRVIWLGVSGPETGIVFGGCRDRGVLRVIKDGNTSIDHWHTHLCQPWSESLDLDLAASRLASQADPRLADLARLREIVGNIESMCQGEGNAITIICDNPEAESVEKQAAVDIRADFTDFQERRFYAATWPEALAHAAAAARLFYANESIATEDMP